MEYYITQCITGFIGFNENLEIAAFKLFKEDEISSNLLKIEENEILDEEIELIKELSSENAIFSIETTKRRSEYKILKNYENIRVETPNKGGEYLRENLKSIYQKIGFLDKEDSINNEAQNKKIKEIYQKVAILKIKKASEKEDKLLIQAVNSIDDIDDAIAKLIERIRDWYTIYFPEMDIIHNNETYIKLIALSEDRDDIIKNYGDYFNEEISFSSGADIEETDLIMVKSFAESIYSLQNSRKDLEEYIDKKMEEITPNLRDLLGATLGAKLIAHIGSIKRLATFPASTIQIMGAEKAVFRHLKTGERPPKHGLIFQHPSVRGAKWWNRGKVARNLALKITFAVRKDVFTKEYNPKIAEDYLKKVEEIEKENPFPKKTSKRQNAEKQREKNSRKSKSHKYQGKKKNKKIKNEK